VAQIVNYAAVAGVVDAGWTELPTRVWLEHHEEL